MGTKKFSIGDVINESWEIIKKHVWIFAAVVLGYLLINLLISSLFSGGIGVASALSNTTDIQAILASLFGISAIISWLVTTIISAFFYLGFYKMSLDAADGKKPDLSSFGAVSIKKILNLFIANIIYNFVVFIGFLLCIVPGIFFAVRLQFYVFFIIEHDYSAINALSKSWESTGGESINLILFGIVILLINLLGAIACGIGLLVSIPMSVIALALVYRIFTGSPVEQVDFQSIKDESAPIV